MPGSGLPGIRLFAVTLVISLLPLFPVQAAERFQSPAAQIDFSNRYVILLSGVNSTSSGFTPLGGDFDFIRRELVLAGMPNRHIVYFSYSATAKDNYCLGWRDGCTAEMDLAFLNLFPVYSKADTQRRITHQAETLKWLIGQVIKKDPAAQIDIIGFSQGGVIAAYLGSKTNSSSPLHPHIHGIIAIESPLGGLPAASTCFEGEDDDLCFALRFWWGEELLRALQMPGSMPGSLVDDLPAVTDNFRFTSIQSKSDYTVNGKTFPIAWPIHGPQDALIGMGSQLWPAYKQTLYFEELGGKGLADENEYMSWPATYSWIVTNHYAPLGERRTVDWIIDALREPSSDAPQEPSVPGISWAEIRQRFLNWWQQLNEGINANWEEWWQEQERKLYEALEKGWQDFQRQLAQEVEQMLAEWLNQCLGSAFLPLGAVTCVWISRAKKRNKP